MKAARKEGLFAQLRRLAATIDKEREQLQNALTKSSSDSDYQLHTEKSSAVLVLIDKQKDVRTIKKEVQQYFRNLRNDNLNFDELMGLVDTATSQQKVKVEQIESHLKQYGYTPYEEQQSMPVCKERKVEDKENKPPTIDSQSKNDENREVFTSPSRPMTIQETKGDRTPTLSDFGLSALTLNALAQISTTKSSVMKQHSREYCTTGNVCVTPSQSRSVSATTPQFTQNNGGCHVTPGIGLKGIGQATHYRGICESVGSPLPPSFQTPGIKQINKKINPEFKAPNIQICQDVKCESPVPPVLQTPGVKQIKKTLVEKTVGNESKTIQLKTKNHLDTPEAPELTIKFEDLQTYTAEYKQFICQTTLTEQPNQRIENTQVLSIPVVDNGKPRQLSQDGCMLSKDSSPQVPAKKLHMDEFNSPVAPQLTGVYNFSSEDLLRPLLKKEFVEELKEAFTVPQNQPSVKSISPVATEEYMEQADYVRRLVSLQLLNSTIDTVNLMLEKKIQAGDDSVFTEAELQHDLDLGRKTRPILLLLVKLQRLRNYRNPQSSEASYEVCS